MRRIILLLYGPEGKRRLDSEELRDNRAERAAFESMKKDGLPRGVTRAELIDTDQRGGCPLVLLAPEAPAPAESKPKKAK